MNGRGPLRVLRLAARIALVGALLVLLGLNGVKQGPRLVALVAPAPASSSSAPALARPAVTASAITPSIAAPSTDAPAPASASPPTVLPPAGSSGGGSSSGGGTAGGARPSARPSSPPKPVITSLAVSPTVVCPSPGPGIGPGTGDYPSVDIAFASTGAVSASFSEDGGAPQTGFQPSDSLGWEFDCRRAQHTYTITVVSATGATASRSATTRSTTGGGG